MKFLSVLSGDGCVYPSQTLPTYASDWEVIGSIFINHGEEVRQDCAHSDLTLQSFKVSA